ncbi:MAG: hypothetical protein EPO20_29045 [Betaproteobacteria bacterium]|nr:MAG: hypothetical protein EPO20_29045 [Betaproteobacteria bacterium]
MSGILLIDDDHKMIVRLKDRLDARLGAASGVATTIWEPSDRDGDGLARFEGLVRDHDVKLVVTDFDLTRQGMSGLFGATIVDWCQQVLIPVADFSRALEKRLPEEPNLFEVRISADTEIAARQIASIYSGFKQVHDGLAAARAIEGFKSFRSPAAALAAILKGTTDESPFALYSTRYGGANSMLLDRIKQTLSPDIIPNEEEKNLVLSYICGHLLLNAVLRFPGPIIHHEALGAYCGIDPATGAELADMFAACEYEGPFQEMGSFFWFDCVQGVIQEHAELLQIETESETVGEFNRTVVEQVLKKQLPAHGCPRCAGKNGGFWCPLTRKTVCLLSSCSVASTSWVPRGAQLCRIERNFYDEWAPILGA